MQHPIEHYESAITINGKQARYYDFQALADDGDRLSTNKPVLHFYGGNGFPVGVYEPLITELSQHFHVISLAMRGYWYDKPTDDVLTREQDATLLIEFLQQTQSKSVIGVGHSQGATATAMACAVRPDLFSSLFLLDPVTFTKVQKILYDLLPRAVFMTQEPFKSTLKKQSNWQTVDDYYDSLRMHRAYRRISDAHLMTFAKNSLIKNTDDSGYELKFAPKQELASYFGTPYITDALKTLNKTKTPYHMILGKPSVFNSDKVRKSWRGIVPQSQIITLSKYGHLLPMEAPEKCADIIVNVEQTKSKPD